MSSRLCLIRRLTREGPNDLFLCGDIAQHVLPKHRSLPEAGIDVSDRRHEIRRNYRNTREILKAAYEVLHANLDEEMFRGEDFEILDPDYANRSKNQPVALNAGDLQEELAYAFKFANERLRDNEGDRVCIAIAGYSSTEIQRYGEAVGIPTLDGRSKAQGARLVLSDLEQTKGYEFDLVIIVNCNKGILPPADAPEEEVYRDGCRLYVAMTRAKTDLHLSFHGGLDNCSPWLVTAKNEIYFTDWDEVEALDQKDVRHLPARISETEESCEGGELDLTGHQFCFTPFALGLQRDTLGHKLINGIPICSEA